MRFDRVRAEVPLTDADYAAIRFRVLERLQPQTRRTRWVALAAAAVIAVVLGIRPVPRQQQPVVIRAAGPAAVQPAGPPALHAPPEIYVPTRHVSRVVAKTVKSEPVRIEFQTADPDVRIIWIAQ